MKKTPQIKNTGEVPDNYRGIPQLPIFEIQKTLLPRQDPSLAGPEETTSSIPNTPLCPQYVEGHLLGWMFFANHKCSICCLYFVAGLCRHVGIVLAFKAKTEEQ